MLQLAAENAKCIKMVPKTFNLVLWQVCSYDDLSCHLKFAATDNHNFTLMKVSIEKYDKNIFIDCKQKLASTLQLYILEILSHICYTIRDIVDRFMFMNSDLQSFWKDCYRSLWINSIENYKIRFTSTFDTMGFYVYYNYRLVHTYIFIEF